MEKRRDKMKKGKGMMINEKEGKEDDDKRKRRKRR